MRTGCKVPFVCFLVLRFVCGNIWFCMTMSPDASLGVEFAWIGSMAKGKVLFGAICKQSLTHQIAAFSNLRNAHGEMLFDR